MGIRFSCPNGHKLNVKTHLAGKRGVCPQCGVRFVIPNVPASADGPIEQTTAFQSHSSQVASKMPEEPLLGATSRSSIIPVSQPAEELESFGPAESPISIAVSPSGLASRDIPTAEVTASLTSVAATVTGQLDRHKRKRRLQLVISVLLLLLVIVLAIVLIWVLGRDLKSTPPLKTAGMQNCLLQSVAG